MVPAALLVTVAVAAAGCGGSSSASTTTGSGATTTGSRSSGSDASPRSGTSTSSNSGGKSSTPPKRTAKVTIKNFKYMPATITVKAGTKVTWTDADTANHTVTADHGSTPRIANLNKGQSATVRFRTPGTYAYHCDYHPFMHGKVIVK